MITWQRSGKVRPGKWQEAVQYALEVAEHLKSKPPQVLAMRVYQEVFGNVGTIHWFADHESLAALEDHAAQRASDEEWLDFGRRADDLFIAGSWHDTVMESL